MDQYPSEKNCTVQTIKDLINFFYIFQIQKRIPGLHQDTSISSVSITDVWEPIEEGLVPLSLLFFKSFSSYYIFFWSVFLVFGVFILQFGDDTSCFYDLYLLITC